MAEIHSFVDLYRIFRCEPMHFLSHDISVMWKECLFWTFKYDKRYTLAMMSRSESASTLKSMSKSVLHSTNSFLKRVDNASVVYGTHVYFTKSNRTDYLSVFLPEVVLRRCWKRKTLTP